MPKKKETIVQMRKRLACRSRGCSPRTEGIAAGYDEAKRKADKALKSL